MRTIRWVFVLTILLSFSTIFAQNFCSDIVQLAQSTIADSCDSLGRNQACYGNTTIDATLYPDYDEVFSSVGDRAKIEAFEAIRTSALNEETGDWGIAYLTIQANLPDTLPGQNVVMLLFGDVDVNNSGGAIPIPEVIAIANSGANVRSGASTEFGIRDSLSSGETVVIDGRNEAGDWLRYTNDSGVTGWISASLFTVEGDVAALPVIINNEVAESEYGAMQAFYFQSGITATTCIEAPESGILIQTPASEAIELLINDVELTIRSTIFLQAPSEVMIVRVLEGVVDVRSSGTTVIVPAGTQVSVPLDENGRANGTPSDPIPYDGDVVQPLPVEILSNSIEIIDPLPEETIQETVDAIITQRLQTGAFGQWIATDPDGSTVTLEITDTGSGQVQLVYFDDRATLCGGSPASGSGTGVIDASGNVVGTMAYECLNPSSVLGTFPSSFLYNLEFDTLLDQIGVVWSRQN